jgi:putative oxidoreductase
MLKKIFENEIVSFIILIMRLYLGGWFIHHVIAQGMYHPNSWAKIGSAMQFLGINFLPQFWGFMAVFAYLIGSLFLISGVYFRLGAASMAFVLLVAVNMHFGLGQGFAMAKYALIFLVVFLILIFTGPGRYSLTGYLKK